MRRCKNCGEEIDDDTYLYNEGYCNECIKGIRAEHSKTIERIETEESEFEEEQKDWDEFLTTEEEWEEE